MVVKWMFHGQPRQAGVIIRLSVLRMAPADKRQDDHDESRGPDGSAPRAR